ncbi:uncharacterized protein PITG_00979 [Phytophthora infestans T30-4]|uniref:Vesicle-associated membrane protein n=1 Tax=Phytophthora infestans (strain T30-4) TaxID=403677 RepID=D0MS55_PHYIT|nr:uncharacterized protein PITG_00979 [Phytophthora infestans T30-4]EEY58324.1 conserved hypothetical protein [Phytophthora infestans T30-4]|eukprot:XP_002909510.1 conserved hypothetical protein [Phytophthora infestans T30-4]
MAPATAASASLTRDNIKFLAIARATDKVIVASYMHPSGGKPARGGEAEMATFREMLSKVIRAPTWKTQVTPNGRHSLECDPNKFHFTMNNDELVFAAITAKDYPIRLAFQMISAVQTDVVPKFGSKALTCRENGLDKDCAKALAGIATGYDDRTKVDKLSEVMNQVDGVKTVMHNNIQVVLSNTEKMEVVEQKTNDLNEQAKVFRNTGRKLRRQMWWKNVKLTILLGVCAVLVLLILLAVLGVFKGSSSKDSKRLLRAFASHINYLISEVQLSRALFGAKSSLTMTTETAQELEKTLTDPRYVRGVSLLKEKRLEEAVVAFGDLLRTMCEAEGKSDSLAVAPVYYEYGHALLSLTEATASLFGGAVEGAAASGSGDGEQDAKEAADDLEAAWEVMELARVIYSRYPGDQAVETQLARVYTRLGDLGLESDQFEQAKVDFEKALLLRRKLLKATKADDTTQLADLYCQLAIACIYRDSTADKDKEVEVVPNEELTHYVMAGRVMAENLHRVAKKCDDKLQKFAEKIPKYSLEEETEPKGKGKRKAPSSEDSTLSLQFKGDHPEASRKTRRTR